LQTSLEPLHPSRLQNTYSNIFSPFFSPFLFCLYYIPLLQFCQLLTTKKLQIKEKALSQGKGFLKIT